MFGIHFTSTCNIPLIVKILVITAEIVSSLSSSREDLARGMEAMEESYSSKIELLQQDSTKKFAEVSKKLDDSEYLRAEAALEAQHMIAKLQSDYKHLEEQYSSSSRLDGDRIQQEHDTNDRLSRDLDAEKQKQKELLDEIHNLHRDIESLQEVNYDLSTQLSLSVRSQENEKKKFVSMQEQLRFLDSQMKLFSSQQMKQKQSTQVKLTTCLEDLSKTVAERDEFKQQLNMTQTSLVRYGHS